MIIKAQMVSQEAVLEEILEEVKAIISLKWSSNSPEVTSLSEN